MAGGYKLPGARGAGAATDKERVMAGRAEGVLGEVGGSMSTAAECEAAGTDGAVWDEEMLASGTTPSKAAPDLGRDMARTVTVAVTVD